MTRQLQNLFVLAATIVAFAAADASAQLVNPGFDNPVPGAGFVGGFGTVVTGPGFQTGFWGAENSTITATGGGPGGPVVPFSNPFMLEMTDDGLFATQAWQAIYVGGSLPPNPTVSLGAMFNASGPGAQGTVRVYTWATGDDWSDPPSQISLQNGSLDASAQTWQPIVLPPTPIGANTEWILAEVYFANTTLALTGSRGYVDEARLTVAGVPEPSSIALGGMALVGAVWMRRRMRKR